MMQMVMTKQRESAEKKMSMANVALDGKLDREQFMQEKPSISFSKRNFELSERLDSENEKRPKSSRGK